MCGTFVSMGSRYFSSFGFLSWPGAEAVKVIATSARRVRRESVMRMGRVSNRWESRAARHGKRMRGGRPVASEAESGRLSQNHAHLRGDVESFSGGFLRGGPFRRTLALLRRVRQRDEVNLLAVFELLQPQPAVADQFEDRQ